MNSHKQTRAQAILARMSFGAVPIDGIYWLDPRALRAAQVERNRQVARSKNEQSPDSSSCEPPAAPEVAS